MHFPRKGKEGNRIERFGSKLRPLLWFPVVLFSLTVLLSILVDADKGSGFDLLPVNFPGFCFILL